MIKPRPYQEVGRDFLASRKRALLADQMRVGKTPQAILACHKARLQRILVLCPAIAVPQWESEFDRWYGAVGSDADLLDLGVYSYDKARNLWQGDHFAGERWDVLIADEAHFLTNPDAKRTKMVYSKKGLGWQSERIWALSGTPARKHAAELWPMLCAFGATNLGYDDFVKRYCKVDWQGVIRGTKESMIPELKQVLSTVMLRRTRKDVAPDMPEIEYDFLAVKPTKRVDLDVPRGLSDEQTLRWLEANAVASEEDRVEVALAKVPALADEITFAVQNELLNQTVVFGWHKEPLRLLVETLQARGVSAAVLNGETSAKDRAAIQANFKEGGLQVIAANILAAGTAIDLSSASHGYFLELSWVPADNQQAANRLVSMMKNEPVTQDVVTWPGSADDAVQRVLIRRVKELTLLY